MTEEFVSKWLGRAEEKDVESLKSMLHPEAVLISPISSEPIAGVEAIGRIFEALMAVLSDFRYTLTHAADSYVYMTFEGFLAEGSRLEGIDVFRLDEAGRVAELKVFVRPFKSTKRFAEAMKERLKTVSDA